MSSAECCEFDVCFNKTLCDLLNDVLDFQLFRLECSFMYICICFIFICKVSREAGFISNARVVFDEKEKKINKFPSSLCENRDKVILLQIWGHTYRLLVRKGLSSSKNACNLEITSKLIAFELI